MKDWRDDVIEFLRKNDDDYFTVEWLSNHFNTTVDVMADFMEQLGGLDIIHHISLYINLERYCLYKYNE
jgi:hypothetical protein